MTDIFLVSSLIINLFLCAFVQQQRYKHQLTLPLFSIAILFPAFNWISFKCISTPAYSYQFFPHTLMILIFETLAVSLLDFAYVFLRDAKEEPVITRKKRTWFIFVSSLLTVISVFIPWTDITIINNQSMMMLRPFGSFLIMAQCGILVFALFFLENTYRFAHDYQRKIGRICFITSALLIGYFIYYSGRLLLFKTVPLQSIELCAVVTSISYPIFLLGLLRYRLGSEQVSIPRNTVYSSFSLLLIGALFCGAGLTSTVFKYFHLNFAFFDKALFLFSVFLFTVLLIGSGEMRKRIIKFANKHFYTHKYDYREQFFRLHRTLINSGNLDTTLTELIENMKFAVTVDDAFLFLQNPRNGAFSMHHNKEHSTRDDIHLNGDSQLIAYVNTNRLDIDIYNKNAVSTEKLLLNDPVVRQLKIDALFPIITNDAVAGVLTLKRKSRAPFDAEDLALINAFTTAIGETLFKNRILDERISRKQFDSFAQVSSFIVHDIKNQISTLSLLVKNAERNINNPDFQKSILSSLKNCSENLQALIDKLQMPLRNKQGDSVQCTIARVLDKIIENTGVASLPDISFTKSIDDNLTVIINEQHLFYIIKNLITNALEAMNFRGTISLKAIKLPCQPELLADFHTVGDSFFTQFSIAILIQDSGVGMSQEFIEHKLFKPFNTTKDKGFGIGLYQCKTLIEQMGGKILVLSEKDAGTTFCLLLK